VIVFTGGFPPRDLPGPLQRRTGQGCG